MNPFDSKRLFLCFLILLSGAGLSWTLARAETGAVAAADSLEDAVLRLNSEDPTEVESALEALKAIPQLNKTLNKKLTSALSKKSADERRVAYQAILALRRATFLPKLIKLARSESERYVFSALRAFIGGKKDGEIAAVLRSRLGPYSAGSLSAGAKVEILGCFRELKAQLSPDLLAHLISDPSPEVRVAAAGLAGEYRVHRKAEKYEEVLASALQMKPYQLRLHARTWVDQMADQMRKREPAACGAGAEPGSNAGECVKERESPKPSDCGPFYEGFFKKPEIQILVAFGFGDEEAERFASAGGAYTDFIENIKAPCRGDRAETCGFSPSDDDGTVFTKNIRIQEGAQAQPKTIVLRAISANTPDRLLRKHQSELAKNAFFTALKTADAVFYAGPSRNGGGPDFEPARRTEKGRIDHAWYQSQRPGMAALGQALAEAGQSRPKVFAVFSSRSKQHFLEELRKQGPEMKLVVVNRLIADAELGEGVARALAGLLHQRCGEELKRNAPSFLEFAGF